MIFKQQEIILKEIKLGLLGKNISHSKSKSMYDQIYGRDIKYSLLDYNNEFDIPTLDEIFSKLDGLSITAPYKKHFLENVEVNELVMPLNAINCVKQENGTYFGTNTDYEALGIIFDKENYYDLEIILLGDGSMAKITEHLLSHNRKVYKKLSRKVNGPLENLDIESIAESGNPLVINSCARVFNFSGNMPKDTIFFDYNYSHTFHEDSLSKRVCYVDGLELLSLQAVQATKFWNFN